MKNIKNKTNYINTTNYFTRQEVLAVVEISNNMMQYLEKLELISPVYQDGRKFYYDWSQLIKIKIMLKMRELVSLQSIKESGIFLEDLGISDTGYTSMEIIAIDNKIYSSINGIDEIAEKLKSKYAKPGFYVGFVGQGLPVNHVIKELLENGKKNISDFEKRLKENGFKYYF